MPPRVNSRQVFVSSSLARRGDDLFPKIFLPKRYADPLDAGATVVRRFIVGGQSVAHFNDSYIPLKNK
jgi:hypothetical protein